MTDDFPLKGAPDPEGGAGLHGEKEKFARAFFNKMAGTGLDSGEPLAFVKEYFLERFLAKFIDFLIVGAFFAFPTAVGPMAGITYILISDGLKGGASVGKRLIGLKVVSSYDEKKPCDFKSSIIRNSVFGALIIWYLIVGWIPYIGKLFVAIVWAVVIAVEALLIYADESGARFGDRLAKTRVVPERAP